MNYYALVSANKNNSLFVMIYNKIVRFVGSILIPLFYVLTFWSVDRKINVEDTIISMTSFGKRLSTVWITVESLIRQKNIHCQIHLYIALDEINVKLPLKKHMEKNGVIIHYVEDIKSYKKFYFAALEYNDKNIITVDDDIIYPNYLVSSLVSALNSQHCVCCFRCHKITINENSINRYEEWNEVNNGGIKSISLLPTGVGGVIYPKQYFYQKLLRKDIFMKLVPTADDIWIRFWGILKGVEVYKVLPEYKNWISIRFTQKNRLGIVNNGKNLNNIAIENISNYIGKEKILWILKSG